MAQLEHVAELHDRDVFFETFDITDDWGITRTHTTFRVRFREPSLDLVFPFAPPIQVVDWKPSEGIPRDQRQRFSRREVLEVYLHNREYIDTARRSPAVE